MRPRTVFLMIIAFALISGQGICETIDWKQYHDGIRMAKKENKKVFLHFRTDWCRYCAQMEAVTFKDLSVVRFLNTYFVSIKVDGDKETAIAKSYKVPGYPDNRFLEEKMEAIYRLPGFVEPTAFLFFLEYIQTDSYKSMDPMQYYKTR